MKIILLSSYYAILFIEIYLFNINNVNNVESTLLVFSLRIVVLFSTLLITERFDKRIKFSFSHKKVMQARMIEKEN